jgi:hypothetical protein
VTGAGETDAHRIQGTAGVTRCAGGQSAVLSMALCVMVLIASEFMPASLLTPIATDLRMTEGVAWQDISAQITLFWSYQYLDWISPRPVLFITGDQAHSRIFSEYAYGRASEPKELFIVPGAGHVHLYDRVTLIPWDKLQSFFGTHLAREAASSRVR